MQRKLMLNVETGSSTLSNMATPAAYVGSTFTLLLALDSAAAAVRSVTEGFPVIMPVVTGVIALISGYAVVANDWLKTWKPLFTGGK